MKLFVDCMQIQTANIQTSPFCFCSWKALTSGLATRPGSASGRRWRLWTRRTKTRPSSSCGWGPSWTRLRIHWLVTRFRWWSSFIGLDKRSMLEVRNRMTSTKPDADAHSFSGKKSHENFSKSKSKVHFICLDAWVKCLTLTTSRSGLRKQSWKRWNLPSSSKTFSEEFPKVSGKSSNFDLNFSTNNLSCSTKASENKRILPFFRVHEC